MSIPAVPPSPQVKPRNAGTACTRLLRKLRQPWLPSLPVCSHLTRRVLAAARAPACMKRELRQQQQPALSLKATCAWVSQPEPALHLIQAPRFGTCLEEVLQASHGDQKNSQGSEENAAQPAKLPPAPESLSPLDRGGGRFSRHQPAQPLPREPGQSGGFHETIHLSPPLLHSRRANLELLARRSGGFNALSRLAGRSRSSTKVTSLPAPVHHTTSLHQASSSIIPASLRSGWLERRNWRLVRRFKGSIQPNMTSVSASAWFKRAAVLAMDGPGAPLAMLSRLAGLAGVLPDAPAEGGSPVQRSLPAERTLLQSQAERTPSGFPAWETPFSSAPRGAAPTPTPQAPTGAQQGFYPQDGTLPLPSAGQPHFRPPLAPPLASEQLPTLLTPQAVFDAPTPYAAATARQEAKEDEERLVEEDLDVLAGKIKRILDDEARRNGIQV